MAVAQQYVARQSGGRGGPSGLADVLDVLLDKGLVIDAFVRVSLVGIELLTIDARVVIAGVDTYLHFAEAVNRLDLLQVNNSQTVPDLFGAGGKRRSAPPSQERGNNNDDDDRHRELVPAGNQSSSESGSDDSNSGQSQKDEGRDGNGKGLLSRIADRGQAF